LKEIKLNVKERKRKDIERLKERESGTEKEIEREGIRGWRGLKMGEKRGRDKQGERGRAWKNFS
jgi:hypothetical protein